MLHGYVAPRKNHSISTISGGGIKQTTEILGRLVKAQSLQQPLSSRF